MRKVYIILTFTHTRISRLIKLVTNKKYTHVSISLDKELNSMFSFGRRNLKNPFNWGFMKENINEWVFGFDKEAITAIYELQVSEFQYKKIKFNIEKDFQNKEKYSYHFLWAVFSIFNIKINSKNKYFCSQYIAEVLQHSWIEIFTKKKRVVKPIDFIKSNKINLIYEWRLHKFSKILK